MCDPLSVGILSVAATGVSYAAQAQQMQAQQKANDEWAAYQQRIRQQENVRQEELRKKADVARNETLSRMTPEEQAKAQAAEEARLKADYTSTAPPETVDQTNVGDLLLTGQAIGGQELAEDAASKLTRASREGRARIAALARTQSYGDSFGGLGTRNPLELAKGEQGINLQNNMRQGSLSAFATEQQVQPRKVGSSGIGGLAGSFASLAGNALGSHFGKA